MISGILDLSCLLYTSKFIQSTMQEYSSEPEFFMAKYGRRDAAAFLPLFPIKKED